MTTPHVPDFPPPLEVFGRHRSIRHFLPEPLAPGHLEWIIQAGRRAPTDAQGHMYSVLRITDPALRDELATLCGDQQHIRDAAEFLVHCLDVHRLRRLVEHRGGEWGMGPRIALLYGTSDATMVAENMMLAAEMLGYGTCYIGGVQNNTDVIAQLLALPQGVLPLYGLCIGVPDPARIPGLRPRVPQELCFFENRYPEEFTPEELESAYQAMGGKRDWYETLGRYFAAGGVMARREPVMARAWRQQGLEPRDPASQEPDHAL